MDIGFIGVGNMGRPLASNLVRKGTQLVVYDVVPEAMAALTALGATAAESVADVAAQADIIFTVLPDSAVVERVVAGPNGILANAKRGSVIVDISTIDPRVTDRLAEAAGLRGIE